MEKKYSIVSVNGKDGQPSLRCKSHRVSFIWSVEKIENLIQEMLVWMNEDANNIFVQEYLIKQGWYPNLITDKIRSFQKQDPIPDLTEIYRLYSIAKKMQEMKLLKGGLTKKYDPTITKLSLSHHHAYKEHIEQAAQGGFFFQQNILNANLQDKSAADLARNYQQIVRNLPGSQSVPLPRSDEIREDTE